MRKAKTVDKVPFLAPDVVTKVIPSPTDGWDAISPLAEMDPKRAPILQNWVARPGFVEVRGGYLPYSTTYTSAPVESLMTYEGPTSEKLFAASGSQIWDVTIANTPALAVSGLGSARWQYINFTPSGGTTVIQICNGVDQLRQYNNTVWSTPGITGLPAGFTTADIIQINSQKRRLWYVLKGSTIAAFMPTDAITGPIAGTQDFGALWNRGGYLVAMAAWTVDGGSGPSDYAVFLSSEGQATIYSGIDPTSAPDWVLVGTFDLAPPIGRRCFLRIGSDVAIITQQGVIPISQALPFDPSADRSVAITARIQNAMAQAAMTAQNNFGWQLMQFPNQQLLFLNVPLAEGNQQVQYVMNMLTGAWSNFIGWNANCFEIFNDNLYWGGNDGKINQAYVGSSDYTTAIAADVQCAFNWMDNPGRTKRMTMVQPLLNLGGTLTPTLAIDTDFMTSTGTAPITTFGGTVLWDSAIWDKSVWPALIVNYTNWLTVNAIGHSMAIRMRVNLAASTAGIGVFDVGTFDSATFDANFNPNTPILQINAFNTIAEMGGAI